MSTIKHYEQGESENPVPVDSTKIYTLEEYEHMLEEGTWTGGNVEGMGYVMGETVIDGSSSGSEDSDSDISSSDDGENDTPGGGNQGGGNSGGGDSAGGEGNAGGDGSSVGGGNAGSGGSTGGGGSSASGGSAGGDGTVYNFNVNKAINYLVAKAYPCYDEKTCGKCATAVREALEAGGLSTIGHPVKACDYDKFLPTLGFKEANKNNYVPQKGDIIVLEAIGSHTAGHIAMYTGTKWVSDFVQRDMWGGPAYRNKANYTLFRR